MAKTNTPNFMREAMREAAFERLPVLLRIIDDENERTADRIRAFSELLAFGMGRADQAQVHLHADGDVMVGVVQLPELDVRPPPGGPSLQPRERSGLLPPHVAKDG